MADTIDDTLPTPKRRAGRTPLYPFGTMKRGESFMTEAKLSAVSAASTMYAKRHPGYKFRCETMPDTRVRVTCEGSLE